MNWFGNFCDWGDEFRENFLLIRILDDGKCVHCVYVILEGWWCRLHRQFFKNGVYLSIFKTESTITCVHHLCIARLYSVHISIFFKFLWKSWTFNLAAPQNLQIARPTTTNPFKLTFLSLLHSWTIPSECRMSDFIASHN